jgi:hypothetical protein
MRNSSSALAADLDLDGPYVRRTQGDEGTDKIEVCEFDVEIDISAFEEVTFEDL